MVLRTEQHLTPSSLEFNPALHRFLIFLAVMTFLIVLLISFFYIKVLGAPTQGGRR